MYSQPRFLQGILPFQGVGMTEPVSLSEKLSYVVPIGKRSQLLYLRAGNSTTELISLIILRDGKPMRYFPIGAKADTHVSLAVVEDLLSETRLDVQLAAPAGVSGFVVVDIGIVEI